MNNQNRAIMWATEQGYRVLEDGSVQGIKVNKMALYDAGTPYLRFNLLPPWAKHKIHVKVHRLAAYQLYGRFWDSGLEVDHVDNNAKNNKLSNIRVVTHAENIRKASSPFEWNDIDYIRETASSGVWGIKTKLAKEFNVTVSCISDITNYKSWKPEKIV